MADDHAVTRLGREVVAEVRVFCDAESHEGERVVVERFCPIPLPDGRTVWTSCRGTWRRPGRRTVWKDRDLTMNRARYSLKCRRCEDHVTARSEHLGPVFDTLAAHGRDEISLRGLAARL
jgi:hypothetical protein